MPLSEQDRRHLQEAINEALHDPRVFKVGAVIAKGDQIIERAHGGQVDPKKHAELTAIEKCLHRGIDLSGTTLYTTLEPCVPDARDPDRQPCAVEILNQPIARVVVGVLDPNHQVRYRGIHALQGSSMEVVLCDDNDLQQQIRTNSRLFFERAWPRHRGASALELDKDFRGRWREREQLSSWVSRRGQFGASSVYTLCAIGGTGKSTLTWLWSKYDVCGEQLPFRLDEPPEIRARCKVEPGWSSPLRVLWFSFYSYEGGRDFDGFLEEAISHLSAGTLAPADFMSGQSVDYGALQTELLRLIEIQRCLIVWDGAERLLAEYATADPALRLESIADDHAQGVLRCRELRVSQFLWAFAAQTTSKLLIASRLPFVDVDRVSAREELKGLDLQAGVAVLRARGITGPDSLLEQAVADYEGHPLSLANLAASLLADFENTADIRGNRPVDPAAQPDERRQHIFHLAFQRRSVQRRQLLTRLSRVRGSLSKEVVKLLALTIPGLLEDTIGRHIRDLGRLGFLRTAGDEQTYSLHPVTRRYLYQHAEYQSEREVIHEQLRIFYSISSSKVDVARVVAVGELDPVVETYYHTARSGKYEKAFALFKNLGGLASESLNNALYFELCEYPLFMDLLHELVPADANQPQKLSDVNRGVVLNDLAHAYAKMGESAIGIAFLRRAIQSHEGILEHAEGVQVRRHIHQQIGLGFEGIASHSIPLGLLAEAHGALQKAGMHYKRAEHALGLAIVQQLYGEVFGYVGAFKKARRLTRESIAFAERRIAMAPGRVDLDMVRGLCIDFSQLALIEILSGNSPRAREYSGKAEELLRQLKTERLAQSLAVSVAWMAGHARIDGDLDRAALLLDTSILECRRLRRVDLEPRVLAARALAYVSSTAAVGLLERPRTLGQAQELGAEALRISERCGYLLAEAEACYAIALSHFVGGDLEKARVYGERSMIAAAGGKGQVVDRFYYRPAYERAGRLIARLDSAQHSRQ